MLIMNTVIGWYAITLLGTIVVAGVVARILYYKGLRDAYDEVNEEIKEIVDKYEDKGSTR